MHGLKQIGTICFAIFAFIFTAPLFAIISCDPSLNGDCPDCINSNLQTYSGTSNLQANWQANTIQLHWYNGDTEIQNVPSASQSCVYDGTLTPPATIPTKTGYTFKGWRVRQASNDCFASSVCGLNGSAVNGLTYNSSDSSTYGYNSNNGTNTHNTSTYGLTSTGTWAVKDTNNGVIRGIASCNSTGSNTYDTMLAALMPGIIMTSEQFNALYGSCSSDAIKPSNTFSTSSSGQYCWCKMTSYTPSGGSACNIASPSWVFFDDFGSASVCADYCASSCALAVLGNVVGLDDFRRVVFGVSAQ